MPTKTKKIKTPSVFEKPTSTFSDAAGFFQQKKIVQDIVDYCRDPRPFFTLGADVAHNLLFVGQSRTGKRFFAEALAGEAGMKLLRVPCWALSGTFDEVMANIDNIFGVLKGNQPILVLFEDIDVTGLGSDGTRSVVEQFIYKLSFVPSRKPWFFIATASTLEGVSKELSESAFFGQQIIRFDLPLRKERLEIMSMIAARFPAISVGLEHFSYITHGYRYQEIYKLFYDASCYAVREKATAITDKHIFEAFHENETGARNIGFDTDPTFKINAAYHEAAHALVCHLHPFGRMVDHISIVDREQVSGLTVVHKDDYAAVYFGELMGRMAYTLASYIAEKLYGKFLWRSFTCSHDLKSANELATKMVCIWGFGKRTGSRIMQDVKGDFLTTSKEVELDIRDILQEAEKQAEEIITQNDKKFRALGRALLNGDGTLDTADILKILGPRPKRPTPPSLYRI
jgi:ATP-dependent Zn protease